MHATDWNCDFAALPGWNLREIMWDVRDEFYELPQNDTLCCIYSITEASMMNYIGRLAVFQNKENPKLVLNIEEYTFCPNFSASADGSLIFLQPSIYDRPTNQCVRPLLILDLKRKCFSYLPVKNVNPCYQVIQRSEKVFQIDAEEYQRKRDKHLRAIHGKKMRTNWLKWYSWDKLHALPEMVL